MSKYIASELREGEIFLGNISTDEWPKAHYRSLKTIRIGELALDIHGAKLSPDYCRPIFIHKSEEAAYDRIMQDRFNNLIYSNVNLEKQEPIEPGTQLSLI